MSGHSKWATTKHQKAAADAKRSNLFTKIANMISVAARSGGDPSMNFQLRLAMDKGRAANMPKDKIDRAIKRGTGELGGAQIEEILYEVYGPSGTAVLVETLTDNKNRSVAEIKAVLNKLGGKMAGSGSVAYLFERRGELKIKNHGSINSDQDAEEAIINSGADDYLKLEDDFLVFCMPAELANVKNSLQESGLTIESTEQVWHPKITVDLDDDKSAKVIKMLETLDELDDVANVSSNLG